MRASILFITKYINKKRWLALGYFALVLECLTPIIVALMQRDIIDKVFINKKYDLFYLLLVMYVIFFFATKLWFSLRKVSFFHISYHLQMNMTKIFLDKVYKLKSEVLNLEHSGKLLNNVRTDLSDACNTCVNEIMSETVKIILSIIFLSVSIAYINPLMLILVVIIAFIYYIFLNKFGEKTKQYAESVRKKKSNLSVTILESISSVKEVSAFGKREERISHFEEQFNIYYKALIKEGLFKIKVILISEPFLYITKLLVILIGGINAISSNVSVGEFVISFTLVDQLVTVLGDLFKKALIGKRLTASVNAIKDVMDNENVKFGKEELTDVKSIKFRNINFRYTKESEFIFENLNLDLPIGKKIAFIGESGSGKSTIARLLLRIYEAEKGEVRINDLASNKYNNSYTNKISAVLQNPYFLPISIKDNLLLGKEFDEEVVDYMCKGMLCSDFIENFELGYENLVGERANNLSGGQKQRLAIVRSMLKNADVLILDEATSALDIKTEYYVQKKIDEIRKNKTTIVIAHRMSTIQNADIIFILDKGKVIDKGTHKDLIEKSPIYKNLYQTQLETC